MSNGTCKIIKFQLTAARRRLGYPRGFQCHHDCFNSQPPEGGWILQPSTTLLENPFQLTAARRRLENANVSKMTVKSFQLTAARRRLDGTTCNSSALKAFQLTAARRRLVPPLKPLTGKACIALFR